MRWRDAGQSPSTLFGLEYYTLIPIIPYCVLFYQSPLWTVLLLFWFVFMWAINKHYRMRLIDVWTWIERFFYGDWRFR
ncbi:hypothetical protein HER14_15640 [Acidithiobacillus thiooxidans]|uniref:hypothetical protein n=1 Tax=Acidithiobacillus thiooxidans TaxID=930 RepID=UPI001C0777DC|nr:hypothetical protein [Acidithiobacillus thiooxidans]MBU2752324.1 hypothetical protein [Acidithiobacillus thiooxidans]